MEEQLVELLKQMNKRLKTIEEKIDMLFEEEDDEDEDDEDENHDEDRPQTSAKLKKLLVEAGLSLAPAATAAPVKRKYKERDMSCIAPKCGKRSKGPRNHYLCEKHENAPESKWKKWQEDRRIARITDQ